MFRFRVPVPVVVPRNLSVGTRMETYFNMFLILLPKFYPILNGIYLGDTLLDRFLQVLDLPGTHAHSY